MGLTEMQLGKNGLTNNFIQDLKSRFEKHDNIRISVLKSARGDDRRKMKEFSEKILGDLGKNYTAKIIGFKIIIKKWRKPRI